MLTLSGDKKDITAAYDDDANSYATKPMTFKGLQNQLALLSYYWIEVVKRPTRINRYKFQTTSTLPVFVKKLPAKSQRVTQEFERLLGEYRRAVYELIEKWRQHNKSLFNGLLASCSWMARTVEVGYA